MSAAITSILIGAAAKVGAPIVKGVLDTTWRDPEGIVTERRFFTRDELETGVVRFKPDSLPAAAWGQSILYDPLEPIVR